MFNSFLSALIYEILDFLSKHPDFFDHDRNENEGPLQNFKAPIVFKRYLATVSGTHFLKDLRLILQVINGADLSTLSLKGSEFFKAMLQFFIENFAAKLDELDARFYLLPYEDRVKKAHDLLDSDSKVSNALRELIVTNSYQELAQTLEQLSKNVAEADTIMVQVPRDISRELKKEMRTVIANEHPTSFPVFQINRQLIGGFRIFINGESIDHSWFSQVQKLSSLTSNK